MTAFRFRIKSPARRHLQLLARRITSTATWSSVRNPRTARILPCTTSRTNSCHRQNRSTAVYSRRIRCHQARVASTLVSHFTDDTRGAPCFVLRMSRFRISARVPSILTEGLSRLGEQDKGAHIWRSGDIAPLFLDLGSGRRWVVSFKPRPL